MVMQIIDGMPWFGLPPFEPCGVKPPPRRASGDVAYVRRVLLSYLAGRPISAVARRTGCGERLVYEIIREHIYDIDEGVTPQARLPHWMSLGLVGIIDAPLDSFQDVPAVQPTWSDSDLDAIAVCLVCHRPLAGFELEDGRRDGSIIDADDDRFDESWPPAKVGGHLIRHFRLSQDPNRRPRMPAGSRRDFFNLLSTPQSEDERRVEKAMRTFDRRTPSDRLIDAETSYWSEYARPRGENAVRPRLAGETLSEGEAQRWWRAMLAGKATGWPQPSARSWTVNRGHNRSALH